MSRDLANAEVFNLPLVGRSKNSLLDFSGGGCGLKSLVAVDLTLVAPHPDRFALRPPHEGSVTLGIPNPNH